MKGNCGKLINLGVGFQLLYTVFKTAHNLAPQVLDDLGFGNMGFYSLAVVYMMFSLGSLIAASIVNMLGERFSIVSGSITYALYNGSFILASAPSQFPEKADSWYMQENFITFVILFCSATCGLGASVIWVSQGRYISRIANDSNKGLYNSVFWSFYASAMLIGTLFGALVLKNTNSFTFYCVLTSINILASLFFLTLPPVHPKKLNSI